jgi:hypothetical protein
MNYQKSKTTCQTRINGLPFEALVLLQLLLENQDNLPRDVINQQTNITKKRCIHYLDKFSGKDWYNWGVSIDCGWLQKKEIPKTVIEDAKRIDLTHLVKYT